MILKLMQISCLVFSVTPACIRLALPRPISGDGFRRNRKYRFSRLSTHFPRMP